MYGHLSVYQKLQKKFEADMQLMERLPMQEAKMRMLETNAMALSAVTGCQWTHHCGPPPGWDLDIPKAKIPAEMVFGK